MLVCVYVYVCGWIQVHLSIPVMFNWLLCLVHFMHSCAIKKQKLKKIPPPPKKKKKELKFTTLLMGGDVAQLAEHQTSTPLMQVWFPGAARDFSPWVHFQCRLSFSVRTLPCAIACVNICRHFKDPVVHVTAWWILETLKHPACTVGWAVWLRPSWHSLGKATWIHPGINPNRTIQLFTKKKQILDPRAIGTGTSR